MDLRPPDAPVPPPAPGDALLAVDVQNDFLPGGALAVAHGDDVVPVLNAWARAFAAAGLPVYASRDWHPPDHCSFRAQGGPWPPHCVAGTPGAALADALQLPADHVVVSKGTTAPRDAYSALDGTGLAERLRTAGVRRAFVGGLATDYCVRATVLDLRAAGFDVVVLADAIRGVEVAPGDSERAVAAMRDAGAAFLSGAPA
jgi:nicotinamidase/pyrazinamidase